VKFVGQDFQTLAHEQDTQTYIHTQTRPNILPQPYSLVILKSNEKVTVAQTSWSAINATQSTEKALFHYVITLY